MDQEKQGETRWLWSHEAMGGGRWEESTLPATAEIANEVRIIVATEFGHYTVGLKFVT